MAYTGINGEDRLVQATFAEHQEKVLGWESVYAWNQETFGPDGTLGRTNSKEVILKRDLRAALEGLNPQLPPAAVEDALATRGRGGSISGTRATTASWRCGSSRSSPACARQGRTAALT